MAGKRTKFTKVELEKAVEGSGGILTIIAKKMGVTRPTVQARYENDENFKLLIDQERERVTDVAENNIIKKIEKGSISDSKWYLSAISPKYKPGVEVSGDMSITLKINGIDKDIFE